MNPTITSVTLPLESVQSIIAAHLNFEVLQNPHSVTGIELVDETFIVTLEPMATEPAPEPPAPAVPTDVVWTYPESSELIYTTPTHVLVGHLNTGHNGHNVQPVNLQPATVEEDPTAAPPAVGRKSGQKRIHAVSPELRAAVLAAHAAGVPASRIAEDLTIGYATARRIIVAAKTQPASEPQVGGADPGAA